LIQFEIFAKISHMLKIRLQRIGKRGQAYFRVIVTEHTKKPKGEYLELLGTYNPHEKVLKVKKDRIEYWVSQGAQTSPTVNNLLVNYKIWDKPKVQSWKPKRRPEPVEGVKPKSDLPAQAGASKEAPPTNVEAKPEPKEEAVPVEPEPEVAVS